MPGGRRLAAVRRIVLAAAWFTRGPRSCRIALCPSTTRSAGRSARTPSRVSAAARRRAQRPRPRRCRWRPGRRCATRSRSHIRPPSRQRRRRSRRSFSAGPSPPRRPSSRPRPSARRPHPDAPAPEAPAPWGAEAFVLLIAILVVLAGRDAAGSGLQLGRRQPRPAAASARDQRSPHATSRSRRRRASAGTRSSARPTSPPRCRRSAPRRRRLTHLRARPRAHRRPAAHQRGPLRSVQVKPGGTLERFGPDSGPGFDQSTTIPFSRLNPAAPQRLARGGAERIGVPVSTLQYAGADELQRQPHVGRLLHPRALRARRRLGPLPAQVPLEHHSSQPPWWPMRPTCFSSPPRPGR